MLLHSLDIGSIRNHDESGKLPTHIACQANAPVGVLSMLTEIDPTTLQLADYSSALPIHSLCGSRATAEYANVRYLWNKVESALWPLAIEMVLCHSMLTVDLPIHHCELYYTLISVVRCFVRILHSGSTFSALREPERRKSKA